ncbi:PREDICTED: probable chromo domain-containing protein LHP1 [Acropora digitifera]|uniref:probable chromo domain-containing protein LHP1 n=1 Tax=Acropora digitifera TaxID=70779 RepID=UPI00077A97F5|nr:PREDICTED: probable chromo domain-containing protein LHP1 [Acropora digitifera]
MKEYYDRNASQPLFEIGQCVWVYTPKTKKGLSKKLLYNWFGPYRIVEQSSPVHYRLRAKSNKKVTFAVHANRMKPFVDPALRRIEPPIDDDPSEPYLDESDIPADSFEVSESRSHDNDTNVTAEKHDACQPSHLQEALESSNKQLDDDQVVIDNQSIFAAERILKKRKRKGKMQYKVKWLGYPDDQSTWGPAENIWDKNLIEHFEHGQKRNQRKSSLQHI